jgi:hypothetical protein
MSLGAMREHATNASAAQPLATQNRLNDLSERTSTMSNSTASCAIEPTFGTTREPIHCAKVGTTNGRCTTVKPVAMVADAILERITITN